MPPRNYTSDPTEFGPADLDPTETPRVEDSTAEADDLGLLRKAAAGDDRAFRDLVDRHADRLYRLAFSLVGNAADAEDVLQETFTGAFRGLKGFRATASVKTWVTRILVTQAAKCRRDRKRRGTEPQATESAEAGEAAVEGDAGGVGAAIDLHAALEKYPPSTARCWCSASSSTCRTKRSPRWSACRAGPSNPASTGRGPSCARSCRRTCREWRRTPGATGPKRVG